MVKTIKRLVICFVLSLVMFTGLSFSPASSGLLGSQKAYACTGTYKIIYDVTRLRTEPRYDSATFGPALYYGRVVKAYNPIQNTSQFTSVYFYEGSTLYYGFIPVASRDYIGCY